MMPIADDVAENVQLDTVYGLTTVGSVIYAARHSGLSRSLDGGVTWQDALATLTDLQPSPVTAVTAHGNTVLAGVKGAVICSHDAGESWNIVGLASPAPTVTAIAISPNFVEDGTAVVGTADDGVFVSTDRGASWAAWNFGLIDTHVFALAFSPNYTVDKLIVAGTESGLFFSKSGGRGWNEIDFPMSAAPVLSLAFSPAYADDGVIYAGTEANGLYISTDSGEHWHPVKHSLVSGVVNAVVMQQHPSPRLNLLLEDQVVYSADKGLTWHLLDVVIPNGKLPMSMSLHPTETSGLLLGFANGDILPTV